LDSRDSATNRTAFPSEITCRPGVAICVPGRSAGEVLRLLKVVDATREVQVVGVGVDTGNAKHTTPVVCVASVNGVECDSRPLHGQKRFALYLPD
jgi:hypothetical protein